MDIDYHRNEDEYFLKQDAEKRRKLKQSLEAAARSAAAKGNLAEGLQAIGDEAIVQRARELGFTDETGAVLHLVPLVHVAWADGAVSAQERGTILRAAEAHGAGPGSPGSIFLAALLEEKPDEAWLTQTHDLIRTLAQKNGSKAANILDLCRDVAAATGGFLGLGSKVSDDEQRLIEQFEQTLRPAADREARKLTGS